MSCIELIPFHFLILNFLIVRRAALAGGLLVLSVDAAPVELANPSDPAWRDELTSEASDEAAAIDDARALQLPYKPPGL